MPNSIGMTPMDRSSNMNRVPQINSNIGKVVTGPAGGQIDFTQAQPASRVSPRAFNAAQSAPNPNGVSKNMGQVVQHPMGGSVDFTQAVPAGPRAPRTPSYSPHSRYNPANNMPTNRTTQFSNATMSQ
jgi:hypothetical protein